EGEGAQVEVGVPIGEEAHRASRLIERGPEEHHEERDDEERYHPAALLAVRAEYGEAERGADDETHDCAEQAPSGDQAADHQPRTASRSRLPEGLAIDRLGERAGPGRVALPQADPR